MAHGVNVEDLSREDLDQLLADVQARINELAAIDNAPEIIREQTQRILAATGRGMGAPWQLPDPGDPGYSTGWRVTHGGKEYESLIDNNWREPGEAADPQSYRWWKNLTDVPTGDEWDGNDRLYKAAEGPDHPADEVTYQGNRYQCRQTHRSQPGWTPIAVPALWLAL